MPPQSPPLPSSSLPIWNECGKLSSPYFAFDPVSVSFNKRSCRSFLYAPTLLPTPHTDKERKIETHISTCTEFVACVCVFGLLVLGRNHLVYVLLDKWDENNPGKMHCVRYINTFNGSGNINKITGFTLASLPTENPPEEMYVSEVRAANKLNHMQNQP